MRTVRIHRFLFPILLLTLSLLLSSCAFEPKKEEPPAHTEASDSIPTLTFDGRRYRYSGNASDIAVAGDSLTIQKGGVYRLTGTLSDGSLSVDVSRGETVRLILDGVSLSSSRTTPLEVRSAACVILELADDSVNTISDAARTPEKEGALLACLSSDCNLILCGEGSLSLSGRADYALSCEANLEIESAHLSLSSPEVGVRVRDRLILHSGTLTVTTAKIGVLADEGAGAVGRIEIHGGYLVASCSETALSAGKAILADGGSASLRAPNLYSSPSLLITAPDFPK